MNSSNQINYIDFGLPFLVADRNIGASTPEGFGIYVSEELLSGTQLEEYEKYSIEHRRDSNGNLTVAMKPLSNVLQDVGLQLLNIPTEEQMRELLYYSEWKYDSTRKGYSLVSRLNGAEVFFPAAGYYTAIAHYAMICRRIANDCLCSSSQQDGHFSEDDAVLHGGLRPVPCGRYLLRKTCNRFAALGWTGGTPVLQMSKSEVRVVTLPGNIWMPVRTVLCK